MKPSVLAQRRQLLRRRQAGARVPREPGRESWQARVPRVPVRESWQALFVVVAVVAVVVEQVQVQEQEQVQALAGVQMQPWAFAALVAVKG
jgi:hypothetical protein